MVAKIGDLLEKEGRPDRIIFVVTQWDYKNSNGEILEIGRHAGIWC